MRAQLRRIEAQAALLRKVNHVQRDDDGQAVGEKLAGENQIAREVARIDDDDHGIRLGVGSAASEHVARDARFRKIEAEPVEARQIDNVDRDVAADHRAADLRARRRARKIRGLGARPAEPVEERGLPGIGIADEGDAQRSGAFRNRDRRGSEDRLAFDAGGWHYPAPWGTTRMLSATDRARPIRVART